MATKKKEELGADVEEVVVDDLAVESAHSSPTGAFIVKQVAEGKFRLYNEAGQAVSPVVSANETLPLNKAASRANALRKFKTQ